MNHKGLALHGLKWNPFSPEVPIEALYPSERLELFARRVENLAREGGFALVTGESGSGKSVSLRLLRDRLARLRDVQVGILTRPQSRIGDFYREMGDLFGVSLVPHNRWGGVKVLRQKWQEHIAAALHRAVLLVDEAQEMAPAVLTELRLLLSCELDSRLLLTVVLAGDERLPHKLRSEELVPLGNRIRVRHGLERASPEELLGCLRHSLEQAGNPSLMTPQLMTTLCEHASGNHRVLMNLAGELLAAAQERQVERLDEKLYLELFAVAPGRAGDRRAGGRGARR